MSSNRGHRWIWMAALLLVAAAWIVLELVTIEREGPDSSRTARVISVELHRLCLAGSGTEPLCLRVEAPSTIEDIAVDDCVTVVYSPEHIVMQVAAAAGCG